jgi:hypothetical protein
MSYETAQMPAVALARGTPTPNDAAAAVGPENLVCKRRDAGEELPVPGELVNVHEPGDPKPTAAFEDQVARERRLRRLVQGASGAEQTDRETGGRDVVDVLHAAAVDQKQAFGKTRDDERHRADHSAFDSFTP